MSSSSARAASKLRVSIGGGARCASLGLLSDTVSASSSGHQRAHMRLRGAGQGGEVIAALERRNNAALACFGRYGAERFRRPAVVAFVEPQGGEWIVAMGIETSRDHHELRLESLERRYHPIVEGAPEFGSAGARRQREVEDIVCHAGLVWMAGAGIKRRLMRRSVKQAFVLVEH